MEYGHSFKIQTTTIVNLEVGWGSMDLGKGWPGSVGNWGCMDLGNWSGGICDGGSVNFGNGDVWGSSVNHGIESVDGVRGVGDGTGAAVWFDQRVLSLNHISVSGLLVSLRVPGESILNGVSVVVLWVGIVGLISDDGLGNNWVGLQDGLSSIGYGLSSVGNGLSDLDVGGLGSVCQGGLSGISQTRLTGIRKSGWLSGVCSYAWGWENSSV